MMIIRRLIYLMLCTVLLWGCSDSESFRISGELEGKPTMNLRVIYYADGTLHNNVIACREGEFEFYGKSRQPVVVEIFDYENHLLGRVYVRDGQSVSLDIDPADVFNVSASGTEENVRWARFLKDNSDSLRAGGTAANRAIGGYISAHPEDVVSTLLLVYHYNSSTDPEEADSLLQIIDPAARPGALTEGYNYQLARLVTHTATDSLPDFRIRRRGGLMESISPADSILTLIAVDNDEHGQQDSIHPALRRIHGRGGVRIVEIGIDSDTLSWYRRMTADSVAWVHGWSAGGLAGNALRGMGVQSVPYFIVCDSTGRPLHRGGAVRAVESYLQSLSNP